MDDQEHRERTFTTREVGRVRDVYADPPYP
jgi:hypothetical protein